MGPRASATGCSQSAYLARPVGRERMVVEKMTGMTPVAFTCAWASISEPEGAGLSKSLYVPAEHLQSGKLTANTSQAGIVNKPTEGRNSIP